MHEPIPHITVCFIIQYYFKCQKLINASHLTHLNSNSSSCFEISFVRFVKNAAFDMEYDSEHRHKVDKVPCCDDEVNKVKKPPLLSSSERVEYWHHQIRNHLNQCSNGSSECSSKFNSFDFLFMLKSLDLSATF